MQYKGYNRMGLAPGMMDPQTHYMQYNGMGQIPMSMNLGEHTQLGGVEQGMESSTLVSSESMEVSNDPRFFTDNVLNYRLTAFASISVVAGLMVQNSMDHLFGMRKQMTITRLDIDEVCQLIAFLLLGVVLFLNIVATYVGVAQPYHCIRLMTAGPTGFDAAALYYLNKNISAWRHFAVSGALISLPMFVASSAFRMVFKFDVENMAEKDLPKQPPLEDRILGWSMFCYFGAMALVVLYIHRKHFAVFTERFAAIRPTLLAHGEVLEMMTQRGVGATPRSDVYSSRTPRS